MFTNPSYKNTSFDAVFEINNICITRLVEVVKKMFFLNRDDEEWLKNRKIMNPLLLRKDFTVATTIIDKCCNDFVDEWKLLLNSQNKFIVIPDLMQSLYRWSIEGFFNTQNTSCLL